MYLHTQQLINEIVVDQPDPAAANALQEGLRQFGEMRTMMQYLFQSMNFRGDATSKPYKDLLQGVGTEEISHVELIGTTISRLLDGSPEYNGKKTDPDKPGAKGATPLKIALDTSNIHHYLVGAQGALPVDAAGNPWSGSYVQQRNLVLDLLYNLMLEPTGWLQKCRIYEMTDNKTARSTIAYLIVRDQAHENAFAKALESLGVNWGAALPIPKTNAEQFPEVKKLLDMGLQSIQYTFSADDQFRTSCIEVHVERRDRAQHAVMPEGFPMTIAPERREEFAWPGQGAVGVIQATAEVESRPRGSNPLCVVELVANLVAGATGYVGSRLAAELLKDGHEVIAATRNPAGSRASAGMTRSPGSPWMPTIRRRERGVRRGRTCRRHLLPRACDRPARVSRSR